MKRRNFLKSTALATPLVGLTSIKGLADRSHDGAAFKMKYAPHFGMFKNSAGGDLVDQLKFMADNGFMALEDNGMLGRPVEEQNKIGNTLAKLSMTMGVFVVEGGDNWKVSLTTSKKEFLDTFVKTCEKSVELGILNVPYQSRFRPRMSSKR